MPAKRGESNQRWVSATSSSNRVAVADVSCSSIAMAAPLPPPASGIVSDRGPFCAALRQTAGGGRPRPVAPRAGGGRSGREVHVLGDPRPVALVGLEIAGDAL